MAALRHHGVLLTSDPKLPSVTTLVAGEPVRGSWWAHPEAHRIYLILDNLAKHRDVLLLKLIASKDTLVHRRLWPEIAAIVTSGERWQFRGLSAEARQLFEQVERAGELEVAGDPARELEARLLVHGREFHTDAGSHAKRIETWRHWTARAGVDPHAIDAPTARRTFEQIFPRASWPWRKSDRKR